VPKNRLTRRNFVQAAAAGVGTLAVSNMLIGNAVNLSSPASASDASPIRLGIASYTFRNFSRTQMIAFMKQLHVSGLNAKDVKDHLPVDPQQEQAALADYSAAAIIPHAAGVIYFDKDEDADIRAKFEYCKRANINVIVAGPNPETLPRVEKFAKLFDMRIAIHNHGPEDKLWPSPLDVLKAVKSMDPRIGCCIDVGHTVRTGTDVVQAIHEVGPRLFNMHIKDLTDFHEKDSQVAVGEGKMPIREIFQTLAGMKYQGFVDLEYEVHGDDPMPGVSASLAYMRGVLNGLGYTAQA
jgi:sugar phosphate isomerase/epimerase